MVDTTAVVVVPTYNEAANITELLTRLGAALPDLHVLVVDDGSPDGTAAVVRQWSQAVPTVHLLERGSRQGLGSAYRAGFGWALARDYGVVCQMDADLSHPPERLPALIGALENADVAIGSRYVPGGTIANWTTGRRLLSKAGNTWVRAVLGLRTHDATAGYRAFTRAALIEIGAAESSSDGYCFQIENVWRAEQRGLRVAEVPITFSDRTVGQSKMSRSIAVEALTRSVAWRLAEGRTARQPLPAPEPKAPVAS